jgi:DNA-binding CsgD family transcriptional regulator/tetratricopeptide (TPR) repeat protein
VPTSSGYRPGATVGRDAELALIEAALNGVADQGTALVFVGEAGIGKSVLLDAARDQARERELRVLATAGAEAESGLPYAGLHRLLRPLLGGLDRLPAPQRSMLRAAFGIAAHEEGDLFLAALAALGLLSAEAARQPLLVTIDDIHWLDDASRDVVTFVARRLDAEPIVILGAVRDGHQSRIGPLGLPEHVVGALEPSAAETLLRAHAPTLTPAIRRRLLAEAAGNPLALVELPATAAQSGAPTTTSILPVSVRLERAFADRLRGTPAETRTLLLAFATDVNSSLAEVLTAGEVLLGGPVTVAALQPAFDAALLRHDGETLQFRHSLVRSAIYQSATLEQRRLAHAALAQVVAGQPDRRAQHRAAAAAGPDEDVAADLEAMGERALKRGAVVQASAALARAAALSTDPAARVRRLLGAAEPAFEAGRADLVKDLVDQARRESLSEHDSARVAWLSEIFHDGLGPAQGHASRVLHLVDVALRAADEEERDLSLALLHAAAVRCWWASSEPGVCLRVVAAVEELGGPPTEARRVAAIAAADPIGHAAEVSELIEEASAARSLDAGSIHLLGQAAHAIGDYDTALRLFATVAERLRDQGRLALLTQTLAIRSLESFLLGDWVLAGATAEEAVRLAEDTDQPIWLAAAIGSQAALAAVHGDVDRASALVADAVGSLEALGTTVLSCWFQVVRGVVKLSAARYDDAYAELVRIFDPGDVAYHVRDQFMAVSFLVDAAAGRGDLGHARTVVAALSAVVGASPTIGVRRGLLYARPLLAADEDAEEAFRAALAAPWSARPFMRARLQLAYGMWLRRGHRVVESREPLRLACSGFDALDAPTWGERARQELRAAGEISGSRPREAWYELSPQELQIAQLAAAGLSNRDIGQRLYLSHRTVASHLYRAYPKLGISSRSQLSAVLPVQTPTITSTAR